MESIVRLQERDEGLTGVAARHQADDWLPVTADRKAKWYYSTCHNVTAIVGAGVLGLPSAMVYLEWPCGILVLLFSWIITLFTLWQMVEMHEMVKDKRFDRYHELGQHAFGEKLGLWIVVPQQLIVDVGVDIVYMVTAGTSLQRFYNLVCTSHHCEGRGISQSAWIVIFGSVQIFLSQIPNFNSLWLVSFVAAIMSVAYSTIAVGTSINNGEVPHVSYHLPPNNSAAANVFGIFSSLGTVAFSFAGHNVVLEIQATMPSTLERPSKVPMWHGVLLAYLIVLWCYFGVALAGYYAFGNTVGGNVLQTVGHPIWAVAMANMFVFIHVCGSYQVFAMPVFDMLEAFLVLKCRLPPGLRLRLVARSVYVVLTCFAAVTLPFFSDLLAFFGGFAFAPTTYFLPCIIWLCIYKPKAFSLSWIVNWICIAIGVLLMVVACIGGLRGIIVDASHYKFYN